MSKISHDQFIERFREIRLLALDVDGVLTDDSIYFGPDGFELKRFNISDGLYMVLAMRAGLELAIVSGRYSAATDSRMKDLGVKHVLQDMKNKVSQISPLLDELQIDFTEVAFVGNEILDISSVAITLDEGPFKGRSIDLDVSFQNGNLINLIVAKQDKELIDNMEKGGRLNEVQYFSPIAIFRGAGIVASKTRIDSGPKKGDFSLDIKIVNP